jgi:hypothetical protein
MTETNPIELNSEGKQIIPSGIKTLTTLTFIGSGLSLVIVGLTPFLNKLFLGFMEKARTSGSELTAKQIEDMEKGKAVLELTSANMIPLMVIGFVSIALCVLGAVWMRKLKKDGFWIWKTADRTVEMTGYFKQDLQDSIWHYYFSSGELSYIAHYKNGLRTGDWNYYYQNGSSYRKGTYANDLREGNWQTWYEDGVLLMNGNYQLGKEEG